MGVRDPLVVAHQEGSRTRCVVLDTLFIPWEYERLLPGTETDSGPLMSDCGIDPFNVVIVVSVVVVQPSTVVE